MQLQLLLLLFLAGITQNFTENHSDLNLSDQSSLDDQLLYFTYDFLDGSSLTYKVEGTKKEVLGAPTKTQLRIINDCGCGLPGKEELAKASSFDGWQCRDGNRVIRCSCQPKCD